MLINLSMTVILSKFIFWLNSLIKGIFSYQILFKLKLIENRGYIVFCHLNSTSNNCIYIICIVL